MGHALRAVRFVLLPAGMVLAATRPSPSQLRALLEEILASGYRLESPPTVRIGDYLDELFDRLAHWLGSWSSSGPLAGLPMWATWTLFGVCVALLVLLLAHMISGVRSALSEPMHRHPRDEGEQRREDPQAVLAAAEVALGGGEYEHAIRLLYRAALLRLDRLGLLGHDPARTNWENLAALRADDVELRASLAELTQVVDAAVYAGRPVTPEVAERCRARVREIWRAQVVGP